MPKSVLTAVRKIVPKLPAVLPPIEVPFSPLAINNKSFIPQQQLLVRHRYLMHEWKSLPIPRNCYIFYESNYYTPCARNVTAFRGTMVTITGPLGTLRRRLCGDFAIIQDGKASVHSPNWRSMKDRKMQSMTTATCLKNMIYGVTCGYQKTIRLYGKGFRINIDQNNPRKIILKCGYKNPVPLIAPKGTSFQVLESDDLGYPLVIRGIDIMQIGNICAAIRNIKKMNLQGQGVRYDGENRKVRSKKGKR